MKETTRQIRRCPRCNREYVASPTISRQDNKTEICPNCGMIESLVTFSEHIEKEKRKSYRRKIMLTFISFFLIVISSIGAGLCVQAGDWPFAFLNCSLIGVNLILLSKLVNS